MERFFKLFILFVAFLSISFTIVLNLHSNNLVKNVSLNMDALFAFSTDKSCIRYGDLDYSGYANTKFGFVYKRVK